MATAAKKLYYKIGEACRQLDIQPYVLRYWETEFPFLKPDKSRSGQRVYTAEELEVIRRIKELLYDEGYTIAGAKKKLEAELESGGPAPAKGAPVEEDGGEAAKASKEEPPQSASGSTGEEAAERPEADDSDPRVEKLRGGLAELLVDARDLLDQLSPDA